MAELKLEITKNPFTGKTLNVNFKLNNKYLVNLHNNSGNTYVLHVFSNCTDIAFNKEVKIKSNKVLFKVISNIILTISKAMLVELNGVTLETNIYKHLSTLNLTKGNEDYFNKKIDFLETDGSSTNVFYDIITMD